MKGSNEQRRPNYCVCIKAATWNKESHGLFDYEDPAVKCQTLLAREMEYLIRMPSEGGQVQLATEKELATRNISKENVLLKIIPDKNDPKIFAIESCTKTSDYDEAIDKLWLITKSLKKDGVKEVCWHKI
eukprot:TRINITY_DN641_c0_g4_i4.p4 TRINITY_DN641_c0_g4~~TRINITY_DN641_c0_g4_i4.p4  ORF type:complete len:130 (-),score=38.97 TRINITY_DN641_c0_g4_i4:1648-2037(-)